MPPHCESLDGPVVKAATHALDTSDVRRVLPFVPEEAEPELTRVFDQVSEVRTTSPEVGEVADRFFYETAVRLHRAGEGAPFTGLKPAGLDVGPVIPVAEQAIAQGSVDELADLLCEILRAEIEARFHRVMQLKETAGQDVAKSRRYVSAMLGLQVYAHRLYQRIKSGPHDEEPHLDD